MDCEVYSCIKVVFAKKMCYHHYAKHLKEIAPHCKIDGCEKKSERVGMCNTHYRQQLRQKAPDCSASGCGRPQIAKGYCYTHWERLKYHGSLEADQRAYDRGSRNQHPLKHSWKSQSRANTLCDAWKKSIHEMARVVGERPTTRHVLRRKDRSKKLGPDNWYWFETVSSESNAKTCKEWRLKNPKKVKNSLLKRHYGITIDDYEKIADEQNYVCAICNQPESAKSSCANTAKYLSVDHCHKTLKIRGLVCCSCNLLIGKYEKYPHILENLIIYMKKYK